MKAIAHYLPSDPPELTSQGNNTRAWQFHSQTRRFGAHGSVASWFIYAPWAHPFWYGYGLAVTHLRPIEGLPPAVIYLEGATHELTLAAIDPDWRADLKEPPRILFPLNFAAQFIADSDEAAKARIRSTVEEIVAGVLSPDTDWTQHWIARYGANMIKGNPATAGQTVITLDTPGKKETLVIDPKPLTERPQP